MGAEVVKKHPRSSVVIDSPGPTGRGTKITDAATGHEIFGVRDATIRIPLKAHTVVVLEFIMPVVRVKAEVEAAIYCVPDGLMEPTMLPEAILRVNGKQYTLVEIPGDGVDYTGDYL